MKFFSNQTIFAFHRKNNTLPFLLYTYLITETLAPFFASLAILTGILFLGRLIPLFDLIVEFGIGYADFIRLCLYLTPNLFLFAIPMASMLGVILCFTRMANDNELIALKSAGVGLYRMLPAVIMIALCTSLLTAYFSTTLMPTGTSSMKKLLIQLAKDRIDRGLQEKKFSEGIKDVVLYVDSIDPETKSWNGVYVSDTRDKENPVTVVARTGSLNVSMADMSLTLELTRGSMHLAKDAVSQTISFDSYSLNIPMQHQDTFGGKKGKSISKKEMTQQDIREHVEKHGRSSEQGVEYLIEYHKRLALPAGCFILSILGLPLAIRTRPGQRSIGVPLGLGIFFFYYIFLTIGKSLGEQGALPVLIALWGPNFIFVVATIYVLRYAGKESTNSVVDFLLGFIFTAQQRLLKAAGKGNSDPS